MPECLAGVVEYLDVEEVLPLQSILHSFVRQVDYSEVAAKSAVALLFDCIASAEPGDMVPPAGSLELALEAERSASVAFAARVG